MNIDKIISYILKQKIYEMAKSTQKIKGKEYLSEPEIGIKPNGKLYLLSEIRNPDDWRPNRKIYIYPKEFTLIELFQFLSKE